MFFLVKQLWIYFDIYKIYGFYKFCGVLKLYKNEKLVIYFLVVGIFSLFLNENGVVFEVNLYIYYIIQIYIYIVLCVCIYEDR